MLEVDDVVDVECKQNASKYAEDVEHDCDVEDEKNLPQLLHALNFKCGVC